MDTREQKIRTEIEQALIMHGQLALLFYKIDNDYVVKKWGEPENVAAHHTQLFSRYNNAGFTEEAEALTYMDLPKDVDVIYNILHANGLKQLLAELTEQGLTQTLNQ